MTSSNFQYQLGSMASTAIQADSAPTATTDANGRPAVMKNLTIIFIMAHMRQ